jgi:hypothetical protein
MGRGLENGKCHGHHVEARQPGLEVAVFLVRCHDGRQSVKMMMCRMPAMIVE